MLQCGQSCSTGARVGENTDSSFAGGSSDRMQPPPRLQTHTPRRSHLENCKLAQAQLRHRSDNGEEAQDTDAIRASKSSSGSSSSAETSLSHSADNNAQGWDNRKCQLIRDREGGGDVLGRWSDRSLLTHSLGKTTSFQFNKNTHGFRRSRGLSLGNVWSKEM